MSDSGPEVVDRQELREILAEPDIYMQRNYAREIMIYRRAGRFGKWVIGKLCPEIADYSAYVDAQQSVGDAIRSAHANEGRIVIP